MCPRHYILTISRKEQELHMKAIKPIMFAIVAGTLAGLPAMAQTTGNMTTSQNSPSTVYTAPPQPGVPASQRGTDVPATNPPVPQHPGANSSGDGGGGK
jgi:hypothetical protein